MDLSQRIQRIYHFSYGEDVEVFWMDEGEGMFLVINKGDYELIS